MKQKGYEKDPVPDFDDFAEENLISFMAMRGNYNPKYASSFVSRNLDLVTANELSMLKYISLLNIHSPSLVFTTCFDALMLPCRVNRKKKIRDWVEYLSDSARIFLTEFYYPVDFGIRRAIAIVHPNIAGEILDQIAAKEKTSISQVALEFLNSRLLQSGAKSSTSAFLLDVANRMLKYPRKYEYGADEQSKFPPLIEKILYVRDDCGKRETTERKVYEAAEVLKAGLEKFKDATLAQQMVRLFYVNAATFGIERCFQMAFSFCIKEIELNPNNPFLFDTMGRIYERKLKALYGRIREYNRKIDQQSATSAMELAFEAMKWFKKSTVTSPDYESLYSFRGEISVMFYVLDILQYTEVEELWSKFHQPIKELRIIFTQCMEALAEELTIYKGNNVEAEP